MDTRGTLEPPPPSLLPIGAIELSSPLLWWTLAAGVLSALLASLEYSWTKLSRTRLLEAAGTPASRNRFERLLASSARVEDSLILMRVSSQIALLLLLLVWCRDVLSDAPTDTELFTPALLAGGLGFLWITVFCRVMPAEVSAPRLEALMRACVPLLVPLSQVLGPPVGGLRLLVQRVTGHTPAAEAELYTDEILSTLEEGEREGHLGGEEADMIERVLELRNTEVHHLMTPRTDMEVIDIGSTVGEAYEAVTEHGRSRYPLVEGTVDRVVGILHVKDMIGREAELPIRELAREPLFVPESKFVMDLLAEFRKLRAHIAVVLDEYGGTAGLVTIEDALEEIVGEIDDEFDDTTEAPELEILDEYHAVAQGSMHVDELNEALSITLPEADDWSTLGGYIFHTLGRLPETGEELRHDNIVLRVLGVVDRRIESVDIQILEVAA
ncbi:MAG: gliding motility protein GldE [Planctomycetota bacterium]|nr:MAG: gliding motility protein GldE [Planctomycetota bacterium]